jgi:hypothetical protein
MAKDPRKRQQKLERRAAKRKDKKHGIVREQSAGIAGQLTAATRYPPLHAWVTEDLWRQGLGWVLLSRELPDRSIAVAIFLVDRYCLGVKDALVAIVTPSRYQSEFVRKMRSQFSSRELSPAAVRKLVEAAVAYAQELGFPPHPDYHKAKLLFGTIDPAECKEEFEFGKDGKPLFISGPNDTPERCRQILDTLARRRGPGKFDYLIGGPDPQQLFSALPGAVKERDVRLIGEDADGNLTDEMIDFNRDERGRGSP